MILSKKYLSHILVLACFTSVYSNAQAPAQKPTPVIASELSLKRFSDEVEALGTLRANEGVNITSSVTEIVTRIHFDDNQRVKKGDILIEMDASEERAELVEQKALVRNAQDQVDRLSPLAKQGATSISAYDDAKRTLDAAKARIKAIESRINQRMIKAPFDGVLGLRNISVGGLIQPGDIITTIDDDSIMKLDISVPELFLSSLKQGVEITALTQALPGFVFTGELASVDSRVNPITRSIRARAFIKNEARLLKPGLLMTVELKKNPRLALLVPEEAILSDGPKSYVYKLEVNTEGTHAVKTEIILGTRKLGIAEVTAGLDEGDKVVTHGLIRIRNGSTVTITGLDNSGVSTAELIKPSLSVKHVDKQG